MTVSIQENAAMPVGMCLFVGLNYIGQRFFAFKKDGTDNAASTQDNNEEQK